MAERQSGGAVRRSMLDLRVSSSIETHAHARLVSLRSYSSPVSWMADSTQHDRERAPEDAEGNAALPAEGRA